MSVFRFSLFVFAILAMSLPTFAQDEAAKTAEKSEIRIGTYDSRAIAIAFAPSKYNPVSQKMREHDKAKADGDEKKIKQLEAWGQKHQRQLHRQTGAGPRRCLGHVTRRR